MPVTRTARKALRQNITHRSRNVKNSTELKKTIKVFKKLVEAKKDKEAQAQLAIVFKKLDKGAKIKLIKKNTANRLKSRLSKRLSVNSK